MTQKLFPIKGPWKGVVSEVPPPGDPSAFDDIVNFFIRAGRLQTRPNISFMINLPDGLNPYVLTSFQDAVGFWHLLFVSQVNAYFLQKPFPAGWTANALNLPGYLNGGFPPPPNLANPLPFSWQYTQNEVYFCNGLSPICYSDGSQSIKVAGDVPGGCKFLELDPSGDHLIGANWNEPAFVTGVPSYVYNFGPSLPYRIRWCAAGNTQEWNSNVDETAGFDDLFEVANYISGLGTVGAITYIFHDRGLTALYNTGNGAEPFATEPLSEGDATMTNYYPNTLSKNDQYIIYGGRDDIYMITSSTPQGIGGANRTQIMADLGKSNYLGEPTGKVVDSLGPGYSFRSYWLQIPGAQRTWVYDIAYNTWQRFSFNAGPFVGLPNQVFTA